VEGAVTAVLAAVCSTYGPPDVVRVEEVPTPEPGPGEVRVRVAAAAVNFPDVLLIANRYQVSVPTPFVPGSEFVGVVDAVGEGVSSVAPGSRVSGTAMHGAFAEAVVVPATAVMPVPEGIDSRTAAAFGVAHRTAFHVLRSVARIEPGERLIVLGAGGGVGLAAVQLGSLMGASVTAVASTEEKLAVAASYGAGVLVNHRAGDLREALRRALPDGADVAVDPVGGDLSEPALRSLRWGGRFVTVGYASGVIPRIPLNLVLLKGVRVLGFEFRGFAAHCPEELRRNEEELSGLLASGRVRPHVGAAFPLRDVTAALRLVAEGRAIGKVVVDVGGEAS
jgi:NADPH2:quinone reductase